MAEDEHPEQLKLTPDSDGGKFVDLRTSGLLWLINKSLLHPRGYALGYDSHTKRCILYGDGKEPWHYVTTDEDPDAGIDEDELFARIKELLP